MTGKVIVFKGGIRIKTIMIVDDEPEIQETVKLFLADHEFDVITVSNSKEAIELLEEGNEETVDLILVNTPVPGSTEKGFFSMKPSSTMQNAETDTFLQKPFTKEQLCDFIRNRLQ